MKNRKARGAADIARTAVEAAEAQHTALLGEELAAMVVARLAKGVLALNEELAELDSLIEARFHQHPHARVISSLPGMGSMLGAEFLAATGGDLEAFGSVDRLAAFAGLAPPPCLGTPGASAATCVVPAATTAAAGLLPLRHGQSQIVSRLEDVLRAQAQ